VDLPTLGKPTIPARNISVIFRVQAINGSDKLRALAG
jgi:hypothetical protein